MSAPRKYPEELRDRSVRLVADLVEDPETQLSITAACTRVGEQLGINRNTLRGWVKQPQFDAGDRPGISTTDRARLARLERENRDLRRANAILKTASAFFAGAAGSAGRARGTPRWVHPRSQTRQQWA